MFPARILWSSRFEWRWVKHSEHNDGYVLVFLLGCGRDSPARKACEKYHRSGQIELFDLHGSLSLKAQRQALAKTDCRKVDI